MREDIKSHFESRGSHRKKDMVHSLGARSLQTLGPQSRGLCSGPSGNTGVSSDRLGRSDRADKGTCLPQPTLPSKSITKIRVAHGGLASGGKDLFGLRQRHEEILNRHKKRKTTASAQVQDYRAKGNTNKPKEVPDGRFQRILLERMRNDSKPGGLSRTRMYGKKQPKELGGNRGHKRPYRERLDRPFSFDDDKNGPSV